MLLRCVRSVLKATRPALTKVIIVDNCSSDSSIEALRWAFPGIDVIESPENLGYSRGNNLGANHLLRIGCSFLLFVNPDVELGVDTAELFMRAAVEDPSVGCVGGVAVEPGGTLVPGCRNRPTTWQKVLLYSPFRRAAFFRGLRARHEISYVELSEVAEVYTVSGACVMFRGEAFCGVGGFDPKTFLYEEEFIMAERLRAGGWRTVCVKGAQYRHVCGHATDQRLLRKRFFFIESEQHLLTQYYGWTRPSALLLRMYRYAEWPSYVLAAACARLRGSSPKRQARLGSPSA